jgi:hypothetical protein
MKKLEKGEKKEQRKKEKGDVKLGAVIKKTRVG